jgi:hypothetical protein
VTVSISPVYIHVRDLDDITVKRCPCCEDRPGEDRHAVIALDDVAVVFAPLDGLADRLRDLASTTKRLAQQQPERTP